MNARSLLIIPSLALSYQFAHAQDSSSANPPIPLQPITTKPYFKILKVEDEPNRHYEKWIEINYIVSANVPPSPDNKTYSIPSIKKADFDLSLQTKQKKVDFAKKWTELRQELEGIRRDPENWQVEGPNAMQANLPILKKWDLAHWTMKGVSTAPADTIKTTPRSGMAAYCWVIRTIKMEGNRIGKKAMFKATIDQFIGNTNINPLGVGDTFDNETGQVLNRDGKPVYWQHSLIDGDFHKTD